jgi:LacI family transcriptional regulator
MKQNQSQVSLRDIAKVAGVSTSTVGYVLQNHPRVAGETRERVLKIAKDLGYTPDSRIASWMTKVRDASSKRLVTLAWLNGHSEEDAWHRYKFLSPYLDGARARALEFGYELTEIWALEPGMTNRRISRIIYQRGIEGGIITHYIRHLRLRWEYLACFALEEDLLVPRLNRISTDHLYNFRLALKVLGRMGYRRIGVCLEDSIDRRSNRAIGAIAREACANSKHAGAVPPLFYDWGDGERGIKAGNEIVDWLRCHKPDVVLGHSNHLIEWAAMAGFQVPQHMGIVHMAIDEDVSDWAGIYSNRRAIGAVAVEGLVASIHNRQFGIPNIATNTTIRGFWRDGRTLLNPRRK